MLILYFWTKTKLILTALHVVPILELKIKTLSACRVKCLCGTSKPDFKVQILSLQLKVATGKQVINT